MKTSPFFSLNPRWIQFSLFWISVFSSSAHFRAECEESRHALVFGNAAYSNARALANPKNDAVAVAKVLRATGFQVTERIDADLKSMKSALREFIDGIPVDAGGEEKTAVALIYFAGHGVQISGQNYLIPIDAAMQRDFEVPDETLGMTTVMRALDGAEVDLGILVLDCCRDNPFARSWRGSRSTGSSAGLAMPKGAPRGMFISFATSPGDVAADGEGENSPFTEALLKHLGSPGIGFEEVFKKVGHDVSTATAGVQEPWFNSKFYGSFSFVPEGVEAPEVVVPPKPPEMTKSDPEEVRAPIGNEASPEEIEKRERLMIEAIGKNPPRAVLTRMATSDSDESIRFNACLKLIAMKDPSAKGHLHSLFDDSSNPDMKGNIVKNLWWEYEDKTHADFLYQDYMNRGDKGAVINWDWWVPALIEMRHSQALSRFSTRFYKDYNAGSNKKIRHQLLLKIGLPMAAFDRGMISTIQSRVRSLPSNTADSAVYFTLAALGDTYSMGRMRQYMDEPQSSDPLTYSTYATKQSYEKYPRLFGMGVFDFEREWMENYAQDRLSEFKNASYCFNFLENLRAQRKYLKSDTENPFAGLEIRFPADLFEKELKRDLRIPLESGEENGEPYVSGAPTSDESHFDSCGASLAQRGNVSVVEHVHAWLDSPNPAMRYRGAWIISNFAGSEDVESEPEDFEKMKTDAVAVLEDLYENSPLKLEADDFGGYPDKKGIVFNLEDLDPDVCRDYCVKFMGEIDGVPSGQVTDEIVEWDEKAKELKVRKARKSDDFSISGVPWELRKQCDPEWLVLDLATLYTRVTDGEDETFLKRLSSFDFRRSIASHGSKYNKNLKSWDSKKIDSITQVEAKVNRLLFGAGVHHVYPGIVEDATNADRGARFEALEALALAEEEF